MGNQIAEDAYQMGISTGEWMERERIIALLEAMNGQGTVQTYVRLNGKDSVCRQRRCC